MDSLKFGAATGDIFILSTSGILPTHYHKDYVVDWKCFCVLEKWSSENITVKATSKVYVIHLLYVIPLLLTLLHTGKDPSQNP